MTERNERAAFAEHLPHIAGGAGAAAMAAGAFGLAGLWWGLVVGGLLLIAWAVLTIAAEGEAQ